MNNKFRTTVLTIISVLVLHKQDELQLYGQYDMWCQKDLRL